MGQEITSAKFSTQDFELFQNMLAQETQTLDHWFQQNLIDNAQINGGFEIEAWLLDQALNPAAINIDFLQKFNHPLANAELARFNLEFNNTPYPLTQTVFSKFYQEVKQLLVHAEQVAAELPDQTALLLIGTLPTLQLTDLTEQTMSDMNRYHALNHEIMRRRKDKPLHVSIQGHDLLEIGSDNVMLEAATTSFQIHTQAPASDAHHFYNAAVMLSGPLVAITANSPYLFGKDLWCESRIPMFEQAIDTANPDAPIKRVSFGSGFLQESILECFQENLDHFFILLPTVEEDDGTLTHLRIHNGTIWRWNRPLIGFNQDKIPHCRIEHRPMPAGPTLIDMMANAALFYGLQYYWAQQFKQGRPLPDFEEAYTNFYTAARFGLQHSLHWFDETIEPSELLIKHLLPQAVQGLQLLNVDTRDQKTFLNIIRDRIEKKQTGAVWQRNFIAEHGCTMTELTAAYMQRQRTDSPVHTWDYRYINK